MTIKQQGGIFGRNPTFNDVTVDGTLTSASASFDALDNTPIGSTTPSTGDFTTITGEAVKSGYIADFRNTRSNQDAGGLYVQTRYNNSVNSILKLSTNSGSSTALEVRGNLDMDVYGSIIMKNAGEGIDFSATSGTGTSELFDDYENGAWTPSFSATGLSGVTIGGGTAGYYTKVGNKVTAWFTIYTAGTFTKGSAALFIAGLPYTSANNTGGQGAISFHNATRFDASPPIAARVDSNSTSIKLYSSINATGAGTDPVSVSSSNMRSAAAENCNFVSGTVTYMV